eukprot:scaffold24667_cov58-Phaeocystis_antarctica.AAC.2
MQPRYMGLQLNLFKVHVLSGSVHASRAPPCVSPRAPRPLTAQSVAAKQTGSHPCVGGEERSDPSPPQGLLPLQSAGRSARGPTKCRRRCRTRRPPPRRAASPHA